MFTLAADWSILPIYMYLLTIVKLNIPVFNPGHMWINWHGNFPPKNWVKRHSFIWKYACRPTYMTQNGWNHGSTSLKYKFYSRNIVTYKNFLMGLCLCSKAVLKLYSVEIILQISESSLCSNKLSNLYSAAFYSLVSSSTTSTSAWGWEVTVTTPPVISTGTSTSMLHYHSVE